MKTLARAGVCVVAMALVPLAGQTASATTATARTDAMLTADDTIYDVPAQLPDQPGVMVKAQQYPMTYPKLTVKNPLKPSQNLIVPQIGSPAAGPPACITDPSIARADCKVPGTQYRVMYTDKRWVPDAQGGGTVADGTVAATALVLVPPDVAPDAPVVAWAHPTLGQADQCSISRGTQPIPMGDGTTGPGGMDMNLLDTSFILDQMLDAGYVVVMPDYLGIAVNGVTGEQKTYILGPQEARDLFYAVKALQTPADPAAGWPGVTAGGDFVAVGHSQGGHAAMWAGVEADTLEPQTGLRLAGVAAIAPATDITQIVNTQWDAQVNWVLGPEVMQTYLGYLPDFVRDNNVLTSQGWQSLPSFEQMCTTQALVASNPYYPNGPEGPGTPFMLDPNDPDNQQAYQNWGVLLTAMTPTIAQGKPNSFPKDMPLILISGTADDIVISQVNAAMQESFCNAGAAMRTYWTPVATGIANPAGATSPSASQAANHLNVLSFPFADNVASGGPAVAQLPAGSLLQFAADRFAGGPLTPNCADRQVQHQARAPVGKVPSWYIFPQVDFSSGGFDASSPQFYETNGSPLLPLPVKGNPAPALGTVVMKTLGQTGCGFQFQRKGVGYVENPACIQWGLWPYGTLAYPDARVGRTWGSYPLRFAAVQASAVQPGSAQASSIRRAKLRVDVDPDRPARNYDIVVQRRTHAGWVKARSIRTRGERDVVTIDVRPGTYRAVLPVQLHHHRCHSKPVRIRR